jgi:hypothetical protein
MTHPESAVKNPTLPTKLSPKLNKGLVSYVAAAGAAGVGLLALAQPADAEVVYTPANTPLMLNTPVGLDLNNDGIIDFELSNNYRAFDRKSCTQNCSFGANASLKVTPAQAGNAVWVMSTASHHTGVRQGKKNRVGPAAAPVFWGVLVGPERKLQSSPTIMDSEIFSGTIFGFASYKSFGLWGKGKSVAGAYLGLKFTVGGEVHYGWARIVVKSNQLSISATLTGYAYETIANRPIITGLTQGTLDGTAEMKPPAPAPEPATLGRLAQGATGVAAWRATQTVAQNAVPVPSK